MKNAEIGEVDLNTAQRLREAVLRFVCEPSPDQFIPLLRFSRPDWQRLLDWLDISGLALYLLSCIDDIGAGEALAEPIINRLRENLIDNTRRTHSMIEESVRIQREFQNASLDYAVLKGISLCPVSVPRPELRHQFDLDYLLAEGGPAIVFGSFVQLRPEPIIVAAISYMPVILEKVCGTRESAAYIFERMQPLVKEEIDRAQHRHLYSIHGAMNNPLQSQGLNVGRCRKMQLNRKALLLLV